MNKILERMHTIPFRNLRAQDADLRFLEVFEVLRRRDFEILGFWGFNQIELIQSF